MALELSLNGINSMDYFAAEANSKWNSTPNKQSKQMGMNMEIASRKWHGVDILTHHTMERI